MREPPDTRPLDSATWRKASYSGPDNGCVEIARPATWRKASYSTPNNDCVEIAWPATTVVGIRDSKAPDAGQLAVTTAAFEALLNLTMQ